MHNRVCVCTLVTLPPTLTAISWRGTLNTLYHSIFLGGSKYRGGGPKYTPTVSGFENFPTAMQARMENVKNMSNLQREIFIQCHLFLEFKWSCNVDFFTHVKLPPLCIFRRFAGHVSPYTRIIFMKNFCWTRQIAAGSNLTNTVRSKFSSLSNHLEISEFSEL